MHRVTLSPQDPSPGRGPRALVPVLAGLWTVALVPAGFFLGLLTVFGVTPTECEAPASAYCTSGWPALLTIGVVLAGWLLAVALSISAAVRRRGSHLVLSVVALAASAMALLGALAAWSQ